MRIAFHTFGCKVNQCDTESLAHLLKQNGHEIIDDINQADLVVVNTCTVTKESERKARQWLRRVAQNRPGVPIVVTGCYAQTNPEELAKLPGVRLLSGVKDRDSFVQRIEDLNSGTEIEILVKQWTPKEKIHWHRADFATRTRAFIKIEDGCSAGCSYCKIPMARGPVRSLAPDKVLTEFKRLVALGHKEIGLTGIHLGCYGQDLGVGLEKVIREITKLPGDFRFRLGSIEPNDITEELLSAMTEAEQLCPHLHIPLQSGSDGVLHRMNRRYTTSRYNQILTELRTRLPGLAVTSDVMVGFPGETEEEFHQTVDFIQEQAFSGLHVFPFSRREGTKAYYLANQLPRRIKEERVKEVAAISRKLSRQYNQSLVGQIERVLIEEVNPGGWCEGFSEHYVRTRVTGQVPIGEIVSVRIMNSDEEKVNGQIGEE